MTSVASPLEAWWFDRDALTTLGRRHAPAYAAAHPYPHIVLDGFLGEDRSAALAAAFPRPEHPGWKRRDYAEQTARLGQLQRSGFEDVSPALRVLLSELCGMAFLDFLAALTNRRDLIADPHFTGAGPLATLPGGHLALHTDFNRDSARHLDRVLSVLYYLPTIWDASWGGELELWDRARTRCEVSIEPRRDRLVVMAYGDDHWHGHPAPLRCPDGHVRAVVAAHYYASGRAPRTTPMRTARSGRYDRAGEAVRPGLHRRVQLHARTARRANGRRRHPVRRARRRRHRRCTGWAARIRSRARLPDVLRRLDR